MIKKLWFLILVFVLGCTEEPIQSERHDKALCFADTRSGVYIGLIVEKVSIDSVGYGLSVERVKVSFTLDYTFFEEVLIFDKWACEVGDSVFYDNGTYYTEHKK